MSTCTTQESRPFSRAIRKIKVAATVTGLAKSWQNWANEHTGKQDTIPSGWMPESIVEDEKEKERNEVKLLVMPRVVVVSKEDKCDNKIKTGTVSKAVMPKLSECGHDLVSSIKEKIHANQVAPEEPRSFLGNESPTRRRYCGGKANGLGKALGLREESKMGSRSSSVDTEDSGLGEDAALSDNSDQSEVEQKRPISRPKIRVTTMGDLKSKWQKFAEEHVEGQKLNPFSDDFDYQHAMASRLHKGDTGYGRPKEGSKTAQRADRAQKHIQREMDEMCFIIRDMGERDKQGRIYVTFGRLFARYVKISDKVVGILLRCRKHKMVDFEGEMLWQGQDDHVIITLLV
ncbi:actin-binding Rho-activating protein [Salminus brasiliensis]|uniref:actin-binding Rho-activating protein n=1 Tax=Salminus brasiliensis TaxID=930266 RepID=UPI003B834193